ncbi:hypothetical protein BDW69DRAFT_183362 [Aspergillus filifer]
MPTNSTLFPFPRTPGSRTHLGEILNRPSPFHYNRLHPSIDEMDIGGVDAGYVADEDGNADTGFDNDNDADVYNYDSGDLEARRGGPSIIPTGASERAYTPYRDDTASATPPTPAPPASSRGGSGSTKDPIVITDADSDKALYTDTANPLRLKRSTFEHGAGGTIYDPETGAYDSVLDFATEDGGFAHHWEIVSGDGFWQAEDVVRGARHEGARVRRVVEDVNEGLGVVRDYER